MAVKRKIGLGFLLFFFMWSAVTIPVNIYLIYRIVKQYRTLEFLETKGTITQSKVEIDYDDEGDSYKPSFQFEYIVDGQHRTGKTYKYSELSWKKNSAKKVVKSLPVGKEVPIYYHPRFPEQAVLKKGIDAQDFLPILFLVPFDCIVVFGLYAFLKIKFSHLLRTGENRVQDLPIGKETREIHIKVGYHDPIAVALVALLVVSFFNVFGIGFLYNDMIDCSGFGLIMAVFVAAMLGGFCWAKHRNASDRFDLTVDHDAQELILPKLPGKTSRSIVPFDAVQKIEPKKIAAASDEEHDDYQLWLHYQKDGQVKKELIVSNQNRVIFFHFEDDEVTLLQLKNKILTEIGREESEIAEFSIE